MKLATLALVLALAACSGVTATQVDTAIVDGVACAADAAKIGGLTVAAALAVATDPNCIALLNTLVTQGQSASVVSVSAAPAPAVKPASSLLEMRKRRRPRLGPFLCQEGRSSSSSWQLAEARIMGTGKLSCGAAQPTPRLSRLRRFSSMRRS